jgi:hypothetical protein
LFDLPKKCLEPEEPPAHRSTFSLYSSLFSSLIEKVSKTIIHLEMKET